VNAKSKAPDAVGKARAADYAVINTALEKHLDLAWTLENQKAIKREVGVENYLKIQEIISFTSNQDA
jgi:hypothetical protein